MILNIQNKAGFPSTNCIIVGAGTYRLYDIGSIGEIGSINVQKNYMKSSFPKRFISIFKNIQKLFFDVFIVLLN